MEKQYFAAKPGLYRHFKGQYYYVMGVDRASEDYSFRVRYFNVCRPEDGTYSRPFYEFFSLTDKQKKDDNGEWFECGIDIKDRKDNVTGQFRRFERVDNLDFQIGSVSTEQLIDELRRRTDSPIHELDIEGLRSPVFCTDYVVGIKHNATEETPAGVDPINVFFNEEEAQRYFSNQVAKARKAVFKRTFIEVQ